MSKVAKELAKVLRTTNKGTTPYDTTAEVVRIEDMTAWVHIPGGVDETPVALTISAEVGDTVQIRVAGGSAWITGNRSKPPTDDTTAVRARGAAIAAQTTADEAQETAESAEATAASARARASSALEIAEGTNEHFWHDNTGAHITEVTQEEWNEPTDPNYHSGGNTLITTQGMAIRKGLVNLAEFGAAGATIGVSGAQIAHLGYGEGNAQSGTAIAPYYTLGTRKTTASAYDSTSTYDVGDLCIYDGAVYVCVVKIAVAEPWTDYHWKRDIGNYSVAMGNNVVASGSCSHAEGNGTIANGWLAHAEGERALAAGSCSHAEGGYTIAANFNSHAEGYSTYAGSYAHAEGHSSEASGYASHAQNQGTTASYNFQTTIGQFNDNQNDTALEIGNGTADNARSNALTVDWQGNVKAAGTITSENHATPIGHTTERKTGTYSLDTGTTFVTVPESALPRITLSEGTWIIQAHAAFQVNANGRRAMRIYSVTESAGLERSFVNQMATSEAATNMNTMAIVDVGSTNITYTIQLAQNSGSAKSVDLILEAVRIA